MKRFAKVFIKFLKKEDGPTAVEYAVMLLLVIVVVIAAVTSIGTKTSPPFSRVSSNIKG